MGHRIPFDQAIRLGMKHDNVSIFTENNKYGYKININHPQIKPLYERYKQYCNVTILSDAQRLHFESLIFKMLQKGESGHV